MAGDERLDALERERAEDVAKAHAALAAAQDRSYWLDRWNLDLNALMRKPGAGLIRAGLRALRAIFRTVYDARNRTGAAVGAAQGRVGAARAKLDRERGDAEMAGAGAPVAEGRLGATPVSDALNGQVDADDPRALAALAHADAVAAAFARAGVRPTAGQRWLAVGVGAGAVLDLLCAAHPGLEGRKADARGAAESGLEARGDDAPGATHPGPGARGADALSAAEPADAAVALSGWGTEDAARERLTQLHAGLRAGAALAVAAERGADAVVTPAWLAANATPDWRIALYLAGGLDGDRDLYVLERRCSSVSIVIQVEDGEPSRVSLIAGLHHGEGRGAEPMSSVAVLIAGRRGPSQ